MGWRVRVLATTPCYSSVLRSRGDRHALDCAWRRWLMARASCEGHLQRRFSSHPTPSPFPPPPPSPPPPPPPPSPPVWRDRCPLILIRIYCNCGAPLFRLLQASHAFQLADFVLLRGLPLAAQPADFLGLQRFVLLLVPLVQLESWRLRDAVGSKKKKKKKKKMSSVLTPLF